MGAKTNILDQINADLKEFLLSGDKPASETLKTVKSALQYEAVAKRLKLEDLDDIAIESVLTRESKKRAEAASLYKNANEQERADKELSEKSLIDKYLPEQMSEGDISKAVAEEVSKLDNPSMADMGKLIGAVKARLGSSADGSVIAKLVKQALEQK